MKADSELCSIPVVVVSASDSHEDVKESHELHAAEYIQKSSNLEKLQRIIQKLTQYWFATSMLVKDPTVLCKTCSNDISFSDGVNCLSSFDCEGECNE